MKARYTLLLILVAQLASAQKYPVNLIPENLKKGMYAVIREKTIAFDIYSIDKSVFRVHYAITILNENAKDHAKEVVGYDKLSKITEFKGTAYDAEGNVIRKLKQSEIRDQSAISGFSIYEDNRLKAADLSQSVYPYTVEFDIEKQFESLFSFPSFELYDDDEISIQSVQYRVSYPPALTPRFKLFKVEKPAKSVTDGREVVTWEFKDVIPDKFETNSPELTRFVPNILAGPVDFKYDGYAGKMDTWENFGKWNLELNKGRDVLPASAVQRIKELTVNAKTTEEKARILYEYLQNNTRYVSIQLGIGGFQPMEAKTVEEMKYGDCKALSNYMVTMLREAGVKANYVIIYGGDKKPALTPDFAVNRFNHVIVAVPNQKDTLWLECTSQTNPFGYLGTFTGDRYAMMVTDTGGKLVKTVSYSALENQQIRTADVTLGATGDGSAKISTKYTGLQFENDGLNGIVDNSSEEQKKWIQKTTDLAAFDVNSFSITKRKDKVPAATVKTDLSIRKYATVSGKRLFLVPNMLNRSSAPTTKAESRKNIVVRGMSYLDIDTIRYNIPEQLYPAFLPPPAKFESRFGQYEATVKVEQGKLIYVRRVQMKKGEFPPESYNEMIDFYKNMSKADNTKVVFLSKT